MMTVLDRFTSPLPASERKHAVTDEMLMAGIQAEDPDALAGLYDRYARLLKAVAVQVVHNDAEGDDLLQEIFLEIWKRAGGFDPRKGKTLGWITTLARRRAIDRLRKREAYHRMEDRLAIQAFGEMDAGIEQVAEDVGLSDMREHLRRAMRALPPSQSHAVGLAYFRGMSQREIAVALGVPLGTIKTRLELGLKKLSQALRGFEDLL